MYQSCIAIRICRWMPESYSTHQKRCGNSVGRSLGVFSSLRKPCKSTHAFASNTYTHTTATRTHVRTYVRTHARTHTTQHTTTHTHLALTRALETRSVVPMAKNEKLKATKLKITRFGPRAASSNVLAYWPVRHVTCFREKYVRACCVRACV